MLINGKRELAYIVTIDEIKPIPGYDRVEHARTNGWWVIVKKDQFKIGDLAIYIEVDARVPAEEPFMFLEKRNFKIKTQKMCKVLSQGLLMAPSDFKWVTMEDYNTHEIYISRGVGSNFFVGDPVTDVLKITYADEADNKRKANSVDKYKLMAQRKPNIFKKPWARWMMKREWGRKIMFAFFGKKKDKKNGWPQEVSKTDEERIQNMPYILEDKTPWIATEKVDGSSATYHIRRGKRNKHEFFVCSRNVVQDTPDRPYYYDSNIYWEMEQKYHIKDVLTQMLNDFPAAEWITIQGEVFGPSVQKRTYNLKERDFRAFNLIFSSCGRVGTLVMTQTLKKYGIPCVPVVDENFILPDTVEELLNIATDNSAIDGGMREGLIFRSRDGSRSFKAVSNEFLLKYHS